MSPDEDHELSAVLKGLELRYAAPPDLAADIRASLGAAPAAKPSWWMALLGGDWRGGALRLGAGFACGVVAAALLLAPLRPQPPDEAHELVSAHVRSLMLAHLEDVVSTDRHTVKPWFAGKLDFAPPVKDLAAQDFPLSGGRLDYLHDRPVAALVYRHDRHVINLFVWPAPGAEQAPPAAPASERGYRVLAWRSGGMEYRAVSDASPETLAAFAHGFGAGEPL